MNAHMLTGSCMQNGNQKGSPVVIKRRSRVVLTELFASAAKVRRLRKLPPRIVCAAEIKASARLSRGVQKDLNCPHFKHCSGCNYQTVEQPPTVLYRARQFFSDQGISSVPFWVGEVHGWRQRVRLAVRLCEGDGVCLGLFEAGTHSVQAIPKCRYILSRVTTLSHLNDLIWRWMQVRMHTWKRGVHIRWTPCLPAMASCLRVEETWSRCRPLSLGCAFCSAHVRLPLQAHRHLQREVIVPLQPRHVFSRWREGDGVFKTC